VQLIDPLGEFRCHFARCTRRAGATRLCLRSRARKISRTASADVIPCSRRALSNSFSVVTVQLLRITATLDQLFGKNCKSR
jgi:hypothetical protein